MRLFYLSKLFQATVGLVYSQGSHCSAFGGGANDGRDCTCGDKAFNECDEPNTNDQFHVNTLEECKFQCDVSTLFLFGSPLSIIQSFFSIYNSFFPSCLPALMPVTGSSTTEQEVRGSIREGILKQEGGNGGTDAFKMLALLKRGLGRAA